MEDNEGLKKKKFKVIILYKFIEKKIEQCTIDSRHACKKCE